jgi:thioredoxin reductase (NADPH)
MPEAADNKAHDRTDEIRSTRYPRLSEDQIEVLSRYGETRKTEAGEVLFRAGDTSNDFFVVLEGEVEIIDDFAGEVRTMGVFRPGHFLGDLHMLTGQGVPLSAVVREGGELLAIPREQLKMVVTEEPDLSDIILKTFLARRSYIMRTGVGLRIIGSRHSSDATHLREFAARNRLPHVWIELEEDPEAEALLERFGVKPSETPVTIWQGQEVLKNPTNAELARTIGLKVDAPWELAYDLVVVGAGPAGFGASVYGASEGLSTLTLESVALGGRREPAPASRTTWASPRVSRASSLPAAPWPRPTSSAPARRCPRRQSVSKGRPATTVSSSLRAVK